MFGRDKVGKMAREVADQLQAVENIKSLQQAQKELSDALRKLDNRINALEADMRVLKAETLRETIKETQSIVNLVQGALYKQMQELAVQVAKIETRNPYIDAQGNNNPKFEKTLPVKSA